MSDRLSDSILRETAFGLAVVQRALGDGVIVALMLLAWRNQSIAMGPGPASLLVWALLLRLVSDRLMHRCADGAERAVADCATTGAGAILFLAHGSLLAAVIIGGVCLLHWGRAVRHATLRHGAA